jgi:hypothetical protein
MIDKKNRKFENKTVNVSICKSLKMIIFKFPKLRIEKTINNSQSKK